MGLYITPAWNGRWCVWFPFTVGEHSVGFKAKEYLNPRIIPGSCTAPSTDSNVESIANFEELLCKKNCSDESYKSLFLNCEGIS